VLETRNALKFEEEDFLRSRKLPTPVLSGSGSRVFLSPTHVEHPCFNNPIETLLAQFGKCADRAEKFLWMGMTD
jgi:hypothetical protein